MTDTPTPIVVHAAPTIPQLEAAFRVAVVALGTIASTLGYVGVAGKLNGLVSVAGPAAALLAFAWGQYVTWRNARNAATMAKALPDSVATTK